MSERAASTPAAAAPQPAVHAVGQQREPVPPMMERDLAGVVGNQAMLHLLGSAGIPVKSRNSEAVDELEPEADRAPAGAAPALLVDDQAARVAPGQMRRSDFLAEVRAAVRAAADEGLAVAGQTSQGCPWIEYWLGYYAAKDAVHVERALHKFAPAEGAATARDYIPLVAARVRRGVDRYAQSGDITELPEESFGAGFMGGAGSILFKAREGGVRVPRDPRAIRAQLGGGQPIEGALRSRMESAFGAGFTHVRLHTDGPAAALSSDLNARAFTVGEHVAFAPGEYQPGTMIGDALIAHELAHVVQQGGSARSKPISDTGQRDRFEEEADLSGLAAASALGHRLRGWGEIKASAMPSLRTGLRLQRCPPTPEPKDPAQLLRGSQAIRGEAGKAIDKRADEMLKTAKDQKQMTAIIEAQTTTESDLQIATQELEKFYQDELQDAGSDSKKRVDADKRFETELQRLKESFMPQFEMSVRWGIQFTTGKTEIERTPGRLRYQRRQWSREELQTVDGVFRRLPSQYLAGASKRIKKIQREKGDLGSTAAAWRDSEGAILIYDQGFEQPEQVEREIIHEVGHSTVEEKTAGGFRHLPPPEWRALSDWQMSTAVALGPDLGIGGDELSRVQSELKHQVESQSNISHRPGVETKDRIVVADSYSTAFPPTQFFHYRKDARFVSNYARSHPAEDLAESFASYLLNPDRTKDELNVPKGAPNKWTYLVQHYPQPLGPVQRKAAGGGQENRQEREADRAAEAAVKAAHSPAPAVLIDDDATMAVPGQMRKSDFLAELKDAVCATADEGMKGSERDSAGCPWIEYWFNLYSGKDAAHVERAIRKFAPEAATGSAARDLIPLVAARVRRSVDQWAQTGEIAGLPEGVPADLSAGPESPAAEGEGPPTAGAGVLLKSQDAAAGPAAEAGAVQAKLGAGRPLDLPVRARMEPAFRESFSDVRVHDDPQSADLSDRLRAKAFTVGQHVAFGRGEYQPGTPAGDALIAHELAHVVQQGKANAGQAPAREPDEPRGSLEQDADLAAESAVGTLWGGGAGSFRSIRRNAAPALRSGLALQRCSFFKSIFGGPSRPVGDYAAMTPWQLRGIDESDAARASGGPAAAGGPGPADYARASRVARAALTFDIDAPPGPGRDPTGEEMAVLDRNLSQILASGNTAALAARPGRKQLPASGPSGARSLKGHARIGTREGMAAARYRLQVVVQGVNESSPELDAAVAQLWTLYNIPHDATARVTPQERRIALYRTFALDVWVPGLVNGMYHPLEDMVYIPEIAALGTTRGGFLARHETAHLVGGGEQLRRAFMRRFDKAWLEWWNPFNEGMAELVSRQSLPPGESPPPAAEIQVSPTMKIAEERYEEYVKSMEQMSAKPQDAELLRRAYFSGVVEERVYELLAAAMGRRLPPER